MSLHIPFLRAQGPSLREFASAPALANRPRVDRADDQTRNTHSNTRRSRMALMAGAYLGPYETLGSLGAGGMGEPRARDERSQPPKR